CVAMRSCVASACARSSMRFSAAARCSFASAIRSDTSDTGLLLRLGVYRELPGRSGDNRPRVRHVRDREQHAVEPGGPQMRERLLARRSPVMLIAGPAPAAEPHAVDQHGLM